MSGFKSKNCTVCSASFDPITPRRKICFNCAPTKRAYMMWRRYGITYPQLLDLREKQEDRCAISVCRRPLPEHGDGTRGVAVDHCHETGRVRGLLCISCDCSWRVMASAVRLNSDDR
ncbi:HNH endonuclease [Gordonia phage CherryonLim]|uniref:HNH endonuclease n=1 Tax=Gordonia phage CherryonLim TaxID=2652411 RepID=A0A5P8D9S3_9CAUD|nr:endonuclease VII [Gordonia phage CherryonLim]QFP95755.1 HNH endonuclease [Gordonia phage CherryonLim]